VRASSGDATLTRETPFAAPAIPDPGKPAEARALLVSGLSSAKVNEAGLPSWTESGRKICDNLKGALACYCLRRAHDETGQRAGLRRHGEPLGGLLCIVRHGSHFHHGCDLGRGRALRGWLSGAPRAAVAAGRHTGEEQGAEGGRCRGGGHQRVRHLLLGTVFCGVLRVVELFRV
jgi:hypothetical protein